MSWEEFYMKYGETKKVLNQLVADLSQMSMIIHQTHWYMRGTNFLKLHPLMDEFMDEINDQLDVISERLIILDGAPYSTLREMAEHTGIKDEPGSYDKTMAEQEQDHSTQDIFIGFKTDIEKKIWMVSAELGNAPEIDK